MVVLRLSALGLSAGGTRLGAVRAADIAAPLEAFAARREATVLCMLPEPLEECTGGTGAADTWYRETLATVRDAIGSALGERAMVLDPVPTLLRAGGEWGASRYWNAGKFALHPRAEIALARRVAAMIENATFPRVKVIAVDCDNTLWGGEVGEVGSDGIKVSPHNEGGGYLRLQRLIKEAVGNGLIVVAVSKNERENVLAAFRERAEMILVEDDVVLFKVDWSPKSGNLAAAVAELNVGIDSVLFLDDSTFERDQVRSALPDILVPDLPEVADDFGPFATRLGCLERPMVSLEDRARGASDPP